MKDDYLANLGTTLNSRLGSLLVNNFSPLVENFKNLMMKEIEGTIDTVMKDYREISNEEISKERANALKMENTWNDQIKTILPKLEKELESNTEFIKTVKLSYKAYLQVMKFSRE